MNDINDRKLDENVESGGGGPSALHYPLEVILGALVPRLSAEPRHLEEMMAERGVSVDHSIGAPLGDQAAASSVLEKSVSPPKATGW